jgi:hypothetical protein
LQDVKKGLYLLFQFYKFIKRVKQFHFLVFFLLFSKNVKAYPFEEASLRTLVTTSELIIIGYVEEVQWLEYPKNQLKCTIAKITVKEVIKGEYSKEKIKIKYDGLKTCPEPAYFKEKGLVMAFLYKDKENDYQVNGLSDGSKNLDEKGMTLYKDRVLEMLAIDKITDEKLKFDETIEWFIKCAEQQATRRESELLTVSDFMISYKENSARKTDFEFNEVQKERLYKAFLASLSEESIDFGLYALVLPYHRKELEDILIKRLENIKEKELWHAAMYMRSIQDFKNSSSKTSELISRYNEIMITPYKDGYTEEKRAIKNKALSEIINEFLKLI